jgi:hypothetical protein
VAWTAPRTWVIAELVTAAMLNTHLRDNLLELAPTKVTTAEDLIKGNGANALARHAVGAVGEWLAILAGPLIGYQAQTAAPVAGLVAFFNLAACPTGWTEVTGARGRTVVGLPSGGTLSGTVGTAMTNLSGRTISTVTSHTHDVGSLSLVSTTHTHDFTSGAPAAGTSFPGRHPTTDNSALGTAATDDTHTHTLSGSTSSAGDATVEVSTPYIQFLICRKT